MEEICRDQFLLLVAVFSNSLFYKIMIPTRNLDIEINWPVFAGALLFYFILSGDLWPLYGITSRN